ncbi:MAG: sel1 repeat family protein, partial [Comamonadaceae bacterium]
LGHWKAALNLAGLYETGLGVPEDTEKAVLIVEGLMTQGVPAAFYKMGTYHSDSIGVRGDASRAYAFWQLAADKGNAAAQAFIGEKLDATYDSPGEGFWGNREVGLAMLECSYAQGNGKGAFELGLTTGNTKTNTSQEYARALQVLHDAVKFGSAESASHLSSSFRDIDPLTGNTIDLVRADRYRQIRAALERNPDLRLPNLDKVLPLPPADMPAWDGLPQTLVDAAKGVMQAPAVKPTPGAQRTGRAHIPQGHGLPAGQLPPVAERVAMPSHYRGQYIIDTVGERGVVTLRPWLHLATRHTDCSISR